MKFFWHLLACALFVLFVGRAWWHYDAEILPDHAVRLAILYVRADFGEPAVQRDLGLLYLAAEAMADDDKRRVKYEAKSQYWFKRAGIDKFE